MGQYRDDDHRDYAPHLHTSSLDAVYVGDKFKMVDINITLSSTSMSPLNWLILFEKTSHVVVTGFYAIDK